MPRVAESRDVSDEKLDQVVAGYQLDKPISIERIRQVDGKWTVRATFSDLPGNPGTLDPD
jgi:hypothetical protein